MAGGSGGLAVRKHLSGAWPASDSKGASFFGSAQWLNCVVPPPGASPIFFCHGKGSQAVATAGFVVGRTDIYEPYNLYTRVVGSPILYPINERSLQARRALVPQSPPAAWTPNLLLMFYGYETAVVGPAAEDLERVCELVAGIEAWATGEGMSAVCYMFVAADALGLPRALSAQGYVSLPITYRADIYPPPQGFGQYLSGLKPRRRREIERELRRLDDASVVLRKESLNGSLDAFVRLRCKLRRKYGHAADALAEHRRLELLRAQFSEDRLAMFTGRRDGALLGCSLFCRHGASWFAVWTGQDYEVSESRFVYFATMFYQPVRAAAREGITRVGYGVGAWKPKAVRGARLTPMRSWVKCFDPDLHRVAQYSGATCAVPQGD
jgi:hypothetical protein